MALLPGGGGETRWSERGGASCGRSEGKGDAGGRVGGRNPEGEEWSQGGEHEVVSMYLITLDATFSAALCLAL